MSLGNCVFAAGIMALGIVCLASGTLVLSQLLPDSLAASALLAYPAGACMLTTGGAILWPRTIAWGSAALTLLYLIVVLVAIDVPYAIKNPWVYGTYSNAAEDMALAAAGLIVFATTAGIDRALALRLTRLGQIMFAVCAVLFGGAHFFYMNLTVPLVPKFIPPSREFWAYATGFAHIAAGIAILLKIRPHLAAVLLTIMYVSFTPLVHLPMLLADPHNHFIWTENALNLALAGAAWVVAESCQNARTRISKARL